MAKWGEGDPRWIVEERPDSKNVNNWHWTERNCNAWSEKYFKSKLKGMEISDKDIQVKITEVTSFEGDSTVNNRKGKVFYLFDLNTSMKWDGTAADGKVTANGKINIKDITQDDPVDEYQYEVTCNDENPDRKRIKDSVSKVLIPKIKAFLKQYAKDLFQENATGVVLPTRQDSNLGNSGSSGNLSSSSSTTVATTTTSKETSKKKVATSSIKMKIEFLASASDIFDSLTDPRRVQIWTQGQAEITPTVGSKFKLFGGNISGEITGLVKGKKVEKKWRVGTWPEGHFSQVVIELEQGSSSTILNLTQEGIPEDSRDSTFENWNRFYWDRMKAIFGWGIITS